MALPWRQVHVIALAEATRAHRDLGIDTSRRIDPFAALETAGVLVMRRPLNHLAGIYLPADLVEEGVPGVLVNVVHPPSKQRYTAAHELSHHRRDRHLVLDLDTEWLGRGENRGSDAERVAEAFAAWFLMPRDLVLRSLAALHLDVERAEPQDAYELSLELGTSYEATVRHLVDMRLISAARRDRLLRTTPQAIKVALGGLPAVADSRRNIWIARPPGVERALGPTEGDAVVVEVPEIPSSGYIWEAHLIPDGISLVADEYRAAEDGVIGGNGQHRFLFRVDEAGHRHIQLEMRRPWQRGEAAETFHVEVAAEALPAAGLVDPGRLIESAA